MDSVIRFFPSIAVMEEEFRSKLRPALFRQVVVVCDKYPHTQFRVPFVGIQKCSAQRDVHRFYLMLKSGQEIPVSRTYRVSCSTKSDAFSPIIMLGALVLPEISVGMIEASAMRRPSIPCTRSLSSTTAILSDPILQVPTG